VAGTSIVQGPGDQLLARPALALQQHRGVAGGDRIDPIHQPQHLDGSAHDCFVAAVFGQLCAGIFELAQQGTMLRDALDPQDDLVDLERFGQVVVRPLLDRRNCILDGGERGHQDHRGVRRLLPRPAKQAQAVQPGQPDITDHDVEDLGGDLVESFDPILGGRHPVPCVAQGVRRHQREIGLVIDQQHIQSPRSRRGRRLAQRAGNT
jgi:hypothetical protein